MVYTHVWFRAILFAVLSFAAAAAQAQPMRPPELPAPETPQAGVEPGYLGLVVDDRQENGHGVRVKDIDSESPAAKAGLQADDLITAINGQPVHSDDDLGSLRTLQPGAKVTFQVERQGKPQNVEVTLGRRPPPDHRRFQNFGRLPEAPAGQAGQPSAEPSQSGQYPSGPSSMPGQSSPTGGMPPPSLGVGSSGAPGRPLLGVRTLPVTEQDRLRLGLPSTAGAHVVGRTMGSAAEKASIPLDVVITAVNGTPVGTPGDLSVLLSHAGAGNEVELTYFYNGKPLQAKVTLGSAGASRDIGRTEPIGPGTSGNPPTANGSSTWPPTVPSTIFNHPRQTEVAPQQTGAGSNQSNAGSGQSDAQRIETLERRVQELEQKVQELENRQQHGT